MSALGRQTDEEVRTDRRYRIVVSLNPIYNALRNLRNAAVF